MFIDSNDNLFVYKLPDSLTEDQITWYFESYLNLEGEWRYANDVKIHRRLSVAKYITLFASKDFNSDVVMIKNYVNSYNARDAVWIQMKSYACKYLYKKGMTMTDISKALNYKHHTSVFYFINNYKNFTNQLKMEDFIDKVRGGLYPKFIDGKVVYIKNNSND
jgi:hypothetical protein